MGRRPDPYFASRLRVLKLMRERGITEEEAVRAVIEERRTKVRGPIDFPARLQQLNRGKPMKYDVPEEPKREHTTVPEIVPAVVGLLLFAGSMAINLLGGSQTLQPAIYNVGGAICVSIWALCVVIGRIGK